MKKYSFLNLGEITRPMRDELVAAATAVIDSGRYIGGEQVGRLEASMAALTGTEYAIGVSNGLDALRLILRSWILTGQLKEGDGVIVPANTYIASVLAITDAGLRPVFAEPDEATMNISAETVKAVLTENVKVLMPVHLYGRVCWSEELRLLAERHGLLVIEDAAQAIGARSNVAGLNGSHMAGGLGHAGAFSFYPTKNVGALGDAGAVTTSDKELADTVRMLANYGSDRRYHHVYNGFNCRLDPIQAAMLNVKLARIEEENGARHDNASIYLSEITNPLITLPLGTEKGNEKECVWHQFVIRCDCRDRLRAYLAENGVETDIHYPVPPHMQPAYAHLGLEGTLPVAEKMAHRVLSLPISSATGREEAREIAAIINRFK